MWLEYLNNNIFLKRLYNTVPELDNIEISKFIIKDIFGPSRDIYITINLFKFCDNIPIKWDGKKYNSLSIEIYFCEVNPFSLIMDDSKKSNIKIELTEDKKMHITIKGGINVEFVAESAWIQSVSPYIDERL